MTSRKWPLTWMKLRKGWTFGWPAKNTQRTWEFLWLIYVTSSCLAAGISLNSGSGWVHTVQRLVLTSYKAPLLLCQTDSERMSLNWNQLLLILRPIRLVPTATSTILVTRWSTSSRKDLASSMSHLMSLYPRARMFIVLDPELRNHLNISLRRPNQSLM